MREALERYTDLELSRKNDRQGNAWEDDVADRVAGALREAGVDDDLGDLEAWLTEFNEAYAEVGDAFTRLREIMGDDSASGNRWFSDVLTATDLPVATVPDSEAPLPDDPIYDLSRSYAESKARIDRYRTAE
ncbi:hypothetical protein [Natrinema hispanicum]|uniref:hypothetical protein n=1 Tax=Natrinema hispanicum TaxID=392421 RepID=UPI00102C8657|nr:hypothetical protein [Natrinema hispanicum]